MKKWPKTQNLDFLLFCEIHNNIVFPTSVWSEASEKSEYLMNFRHIFVYVGNTILILSSEPKMLKEHKHNNI